MANNILSNGRIQQQATVSQRLRNDKGKKGISLYSTTYTLRLYILCKILVM